MQFLLTQEELHSLVPRPELEARDRALEVARVAMLAGRMKCIHEKSERGLGYCDFCPVSKLESDESSRLICKLPRNYSK